MLIGLIGLLFISFVIYSYIIYVTFSTPFRVEREKYKRTIALERILSKRADFHKEASEEKAKLEYFLKYKEYPCKHSWRVESVYDRFSSDVLSGKLYIKQCRKCFSTIKEEIPFN